MRRLRGSRTPSGVAYGARKARDPTLIGFGLWTVRAKSPRSGSGQASVEALVPWSGRDAKFDLAGFNLVGGSHGYGHSEVFQHTEGLWFHNA
jgi:hypothetical protein